MIKLLNRYVLIFLCLGLCYLLVILYLVIRVNGVVIVLCLFFNNLSNWLILDVDKLFWIIVVYVIIIVFKFKMFIFVEFILSVLNIFGFDIWIILLLIMLNV